MEAFEDRDLVIAIGDGDMHAFHQLYSRYAKPLYQFLWQRTPDRETASDLVQDTFAKVWEMRESLDPNRSIRALLFKIARNLAIDLLRKLARRGHETEVFESIEAPRVDPENFVKRDRIRGALGELSTQQRAVFCMSRFDGLSYAEIAEALDITSKTVEVHMGRALKKLREALVDLTRYFFFGIFL